MKIKNDFVTNSSSCSYIVCIPDPKNLVERLESVMDLPSKFSEVFLNGIEEFYFGEMYEEDHYREWQEMNRFLNDWGYVLAFLDHGPENTPIYINVAEYADKINQIFKMPKFESPKTMFKKGDKFKFANHYLKIVEVIRKKESLEENRYNLSCRPHCCSINWIEMTMSESDLMNLKKLKEEKIK
jgi:hypothetical protein